MMDYHIKYGHRFSMTVCKEPEGDDLTARFPTRCRVFRPRILDRVSVVLFDRLHMPFTQDIILFNVATLHSPTGQS